MASFLDFIRKLVFPSCFLLSLTFASLAVSIRTTRFNIQKFYMVFSLLWMFRTDLRIDSDFRHVLDLLIGFYNRGGKSLQRGTD